LLHLHCSWVAANVSHTDDDSQTTEFDVGDSAYIALVSVSHSLGIDSDTAKTQNDEVSATVSVTAITENVIFGRSLTLICINVYDYDAIYLLYLHI